MLSSHCGPGLAWARVCWMRGRRCDADGHCGRLGRSLGTLNSFIRRRRPPSTVNMCLVAKEPRWRIGNPNSSARCGCARCCCYFAACRVKFKWPLWRAPSITSSCVEAAGGSCQEPVDLACRQTALNVSEWTLSDSEWSFGLWLRMWTRFGAATSSDWFEFWCQGGSCCWSPNASFTVNKRRGARIPPDVQSTQR